jgi:hypothetical protein
VHFGPAVGSSEKLISFLASPKGFSGNVGRIQRVAIASWLSAVPAGEVVLFGDAEGAEQAARETGAIHVRDIECTESGVPYFGAIAEWARRNARFDFEAYLNCDIALLPEFHAGAGRFAGRQALVVGQRINLHEGERIPEGGPTLAWLGAVAARGKATLHPPAGSDYFIFPRGLWENLPPLVIGRAGYDNALIAFCLARGVPVVDATRLIAAIHQHHDYSHVGGGVDEVFAGEDARRNVEALGFRFVVSVADATFESSAAGERRSFSRGAFLRWLQVFFSLRFGCPVAAGAAARVVRRLTGDLGWRSRDIGLEAVLEELASLPAGRA